MKKVNFNRFEDYYKKKERLTKEGNNDSNVEDCRIHLCLFFIQGKDIKPVGFELMKELAQWTNLIPVITKVISNIYSRTTSTKK